MSIVKLKKLLQASTAIPELVTSGIQAAGFLHVLPDCPLSLHYTLQRIQAAQLPVWTRRIDYDSRLKTGLS